jgi:hypothetical protein
MQINDKHIVQRYRNFSCISIGDKCRLHGKEGDVIRINGLAESPELVLITKRGKRLPVFDYHELEIIEPFDLYIFNNGTY